MVVDWNSEEESGLLRDHLSTTWRANSHRWPSPKQNHYGLQSSNAIAELHQQQLIFHLMLGIRLHQIHHKSCLACLNIYGITKVWKRSWYFDKRPRGTEWLVDRKKFAMAFISMCIGAPCNMGTLCDEYTVWCRPHKYWYSNQCSLVGHQIEVQIGEAWFILSQGTFYDRMTAGVDCRFDEAYLPSSSVWMLWCCLDPDQSGLYFLSNWSQLGENRIDSTVHADIIELLILLRTKPGM